MNQGTGWLRPAHLMCILRLVCDALLCGILMFPFAVTAAEPNGSDDFYSAIRRDDFAALEKLLHSGALVNVKDSRGGTPLMYAAAVGSEGMMRRLIAVGADVNARNSFDATALMWSSDSLPMVRLLVEHGADVNARSKQGHTPIRLAASQSGGLEIVKLLLEKGARLNIAPDAHGGTPLAAAAATNDTALVKFLLDKGGQDVLSGPAGPRALMAAAAFGNVEIVKLLLANGVPVNAKTPPELDDRVKNGPIALGNLTALLLAVPGAGRETVQVLLDAGADIDASDVRGMTPPMLAVATDHPNLDVIRLLLAHKPDTTMKSKAGETALDWSAKFNQSAVIAAVRVASPAVSGSPVQAELPGPKTTTDLRSSLERSVALIQSAGASTFREGGCVSCHGGNIASAAVAAARRKGLRIDEAAAGETIRGTRLQFVAGTESLLERSDPPVPMILSYALFAMAEEGVPPDRVIDAMVHNLAAQQLADGSWAGRGIVRPPTSDGIFSGTALAIHALRQYTPPARRAEFEARVARAARVLERAAPSTTEDHVMQLLGLKWAGCDGLKLEKLAQELMDQQRPDGGWAQTHVLLSDAYATGTVLHALFESGVAADALAYRKGVAFLLGTQASDGSWHVVSRAPKFQPYFEGGFPYGHDQWISQWATGWASIALAHMLPEPQAAGLRDPVTVQILE